MLYYNLLGFVSIHFFVFFILFWPWLYLNQYWYFIFYWSSLNKLMLNYCSHLFEFCFHHQVFTNDFKEISIYYKSHSTNIQRGSHSFTDSVTGDKKDVLTELYIFQAKTFLIDGCKCVYVSGRCHFVSCSLYRRHVWCLILQQGLFSTLQEGHCIFTKL